MQSVGRNWQEVRTSLEALLQGRDFGPNAKLPSEAALCRMLETRRHSLRRAIRALVEAGTIVTRQGKGTFVAAPPTIDYPISKRTRASANLAAFGVETADRILGISPDHHAPDLALKLGLAAEEPLISSRNMRLASGLPLSLSTTYVSQRLFPDWAALLQALRSHTAILRHHGFSDYHRVETVIFARPASPDEYRQLQLPPHAWVMVTQKLDAAPDGMPLIWGECIWAADRIQFTITDERTIS